jgi:hypothetical protein
MRRDAEFIAPGASIKAMSNRQRGWKRHAVYEENRSRSVCRTNGREMPQEEFESFDWS